MLKQINKSTKHKTLLTALLLLTVVIFLLYGRSITHQYAIDDDLVTQNHKVVSKGIKAIPEIFTSYYFIDKKMQFGYRPMVMVSFAIEHQFFGQNPHISHFINILLYILNCFLVLLVLRKLFSDGKTFFPLMVCVLFAVHPLHTEVVASIKSRDELLSFAFSFLALWLALKYIDTKKLYLLPVICFIFVLAVFSKQTAYTFLAVIPLSVFIYSKKTLGKTHLILFVVLIAGIIVASIPRFVLPPVSREIFYFENPLVLEGSFLNRLSMAFYIIPFYLKLFIFPHPLVFYYGYDMIPIMQIYHPLIILSFIVSLCLFIYAIFIIKKKPVLSFSILYFFISISMFLNIVEPVAGIVAERFAYFASLSFCILITYAAFLIFRIKPNALQLAKSSQNKIILTLLVLIIPYALRTFYRVGDWKNHSTLYKADIKYLENSALSNAIYAELLIDEMREEFQKKGDIKNFNTRMNLAATHYQLSINVYKEYFSSYNNLGFIYYQFANDYEKAIPYLKRAVEIRPDYTEARFNLAFCLQTIGNYDEAITHYEEAIKTDSTFYNAYTHLGETYLHVKNVEKAIGINGILKQKIPDNDLAYINLGKIYLMLGDTTNSMYNFETAITKFPENTMLLKQLILFYESKGNLEKSTYYKSMLDKYSK